MLIGQRVVGYYPYWVQNEYPANNIDLNIVTHVNHAFAWPDEIGNILHYDNMLNGSLNQTIHDGGGKILLSLGGWGNDEGFAAVAASSELRTIFISNLILWSVNTIQFWKQPVPKYRLCQYRLPPRFLVYARQASAHQIGTRAVF